MTSGISEKNRKILDDLNRLLKGPFSAKDASKNIGIPKQKISLLLTYFVTKGWLSRIRRGLYITIPLGTINPNEYKENPWIVANRIFAPCYIGGWSAAEHWEYSDQIFNSVVVFTLRRLRKKYLTIQSTDFIMKFIDKKYFTGMKSIWIENTKIQISDPVRTIVDILDDPTIGGGIRNVGDIVREYFKSQHRNDIEIDNYIEKRKNRTIYKRLGYLIDIFTIDATALKNICLNKMSKGLSLLDPAIAAKGKIISRWRLRINASIEK